MPDNIKYNVPTLGAGQKTRQQCWYASFKMIYNFKKFNTNQIKDRLQKVIDFDDAMKNGLYDTDYRKCGVALELHQWKGSEFNQERGFFDVGMSDGGHALYKKLKKGPLWVSRYVKKGSYHITVVVGYNDDKNGYFIYNNPFPGPDNAIEKKMDASIFARQITNAQGSVMRHGG